MIKILNIISDSNIGGAGRCVLNFLKYYDRKKYSVKVVVPRGSLLIPEIEKLRVEAIEVDHIAEKSYDRNGVKALKEIIKKLNPDIVHTHGNLSGRIAGKQCGKKVVYTRHSVFPVSRKISRGIGKIINKLMNEHFSDGIIAVAEAAKDNLTEGGISPKKIKVILNGVEKINKISEEEIWNIREQYSIKKDDFVIGILARIEEVKGHIYLIEAAEKLKNQNKSIKVLIAGTGNLEEELKKEVKERGLSDTIIFTGFVNDIRNILSIMDLQVNASFGTEATSLALLEGMSLGIPAVVSDYGGNPGVITSGENGYIFHQKDSDELAMYISRLIDTNDIYAYMKKRCIEIFDEKFTAEIYTRNIEEVYDGLI